MSTRCFKVCFHLCVLLKQISETEATELDVLKINSEVFLDFLKPCIASDFIMINVLNAEYSVYLFHVSTNTIVSRFRISS